MKYLKKFLSRLIGRPTVDQSPTDEHIPEDSNSSNPTNNSTPSLLIFKTKNNGPSTFKPTFTKTIDKKSLLFHENINHNSLIDFKSTMNAYKESDKFNDDDDLELIQNLLLDAAIMGNVDIINYLLGELETKFRDNSELELSISTTLIGALSNAVKYGTYKAVACLLNNKDVLKYALSFKGEIGCYNGILSFLNQSLTKEYRDNKGFSKSRLLLEKCELSDLNKNSENLNKKIIEQIMNQGDQSIIHLLISKVITWKFSGENANSVTNLLRYLEQSINSQNRRKKENINKATIDFIFSAIDGFDKHFNINVNENIDKEMAIAVIASIHQQYIDGNNQNKDQVKNLLAIADTLLDSYNGDYGDLFKKFIAPLLPYKKENDVRNEEVDILKEIHKYVTLFNHKQCLELYKYILGYGINESSTCSHMRLIKRNLLSDLGATLDLLKENESQLSFDKVTEYLKDIFYDANGKILTDLPNDIDLYNIKTAIYNILLYFTKGDDLKQKLKNSKSLEDVLNVIFDATKSSNDVGTQPRA